MARNTRHYLLLALLMAVLAVLLYRNGPWSGVSTGTGARAGTTPPAGPAVGAVPDVALGRLEALRPGPGEGGRNPFKMQPRAVTPPPSAAPPAPVPVQNPTDGGGAAAKPSGQPRPAPIPLKFIGIVHQGNGSGKLAVLSDGTLVFYGREREIIDGRFRIIRIGEESIEIEYADGRGRQTIRLTGGS